MKKSLQWLRDSAFHFPTTVFFGFFLCAALSRLILLGMSWSEVNRSILELLSIFARGFVFDIVTAFYAATVVSLFSLWLPNRPGAARAYRWVRFVQYTLLAFLLIFLIASEITFWIEFGVRFNFIAVDYLIYTQEVIGNIVESYPLVPILSGVAALALLLAWLTKRYWLRDTYVPTRLRTRAVVAGVMVLGAVLLTKVFDGDIKDRSANAYNNELASNGVYAFFQAYRRNELDFKRFYATLPEAEMRAALQGEINEAAGATHAAAASAPASANDATVAPANSDGAAVTPANSNSAALTPANTNGAALTPANTNGAALTPARVTPVGAERRPNIVMITVESLSADYLGVFGEKRNLTPNLDRLAPESMLFTNLYAIGTRTVRGLEALSAALPPLPGQSLVRRRNNGNLFTLGSVLRERGYSTKFIYGGYGYFDNMNAYFAANGYEIIDRSSMPSEKVGFANVWGVADEYLLNRTLEELDAGHASGKPVLAQVMTTSNHRPYTYPAGRIDIPSKSGRPGAVKYTDYAIGRFIEQARAKPWFDNTIFVIIADHCASSAGKERLSIPKFHIPALVYAPKLVKPARIDRLTSQIDIAPTLLGMLNISYSSWFLGHDVLRDSGDEQRAFIANYQEVGYLRIGDDGVKRFVVLSPKRRVSVYRVGSDGESLLPENPQPDLVREALGYYQGADYLLKQRLYAATPPRLVGEVAAPPRRN